MDAANSAVYYGPGPDATFSADGGPWAPREKRYRAIDVNVSKAAAPSVSNRLGWAEYQQTSDNRTFVKTLPIHSGALNVKEEPPVIVLVRHMRPISVLEPLLAF